MSRLSIELSPDQHKKIKKLASINGKSIKDFMLEKVSEEDQKLSKTTKQAIKDANTGNGLNKYKNVNEFFEEILD